LDEFVCVIVILFIVIHLPAAFHYFVQNLNINLIFHQVKIIA